MAHETKPLPYIYGLLAAHAVAQAQAFQKMGHARVMGMELQQAKADATKLQAELKSNDDALQSNEALAATLQAVIQSNDEQLRSKLPCAKYVRQVSIPPTLLPSSLRALMPAAQLTAARDAKTWVYEVCVRDSDNAYHWHVEDFKR